MWKTQKSSPTSEAEIIVQYYIQYVRIFKTSLTQSITIIDLKKRIALKLHWTQSLQLMISIIYINLKIKPLKPKLFYLYTFFKNISYITQIFLTAASHLKLEWGYSSVTGCCQENVTPFVFSNPWKITMNQSWVWNLISIPTFLLPKEKEAYVKFKRPKLDIKIWVSSKQKIFI